MGLGRVASWECLTVLLDGSIGPLLTYPLNSFGLCYDLRPWPRGVTWEWHRGQLEGSNCCSSWPQSLSKPTLREVPAKPTWLDLLKSVSRSWGIMFNWQFAAHKTRRYWKRTKVLLEARERKEENFPEMPNEKWDINFSSPFWTNFAFHKSFL